MCLCHRSELVSEREQTAQLQAKLSSCLQEKLRAERKIEALELEKRSLDDQKQYQEQNSVKEGLFSCQKPEQPHKSGVSSEEDASHYCNQVNGATPQL